MDLPAQAYVKRILRTNNYLTGFEDACNFIDEENKVVRHFVSSLRIAIEGLPADHKEYFNSSKVLSRPWRNPGIDEFFKVSIRNDRPVSYSIQLYKRVNVSLSQSMRRQGYLYDFDQIYEAGSKPKTPHYPRVYDRHSLDSDNDKEAIKDSQLNNFMESKITKISESDLLALLKEKFEENSVPCTLIPKLIPILMKSVEEEGFSKVISLSEIANKEYSLIPTMYIEQRQIEDNTTLSEVNSQLSDLYKRLLNM